LFVSNNLIIRNNTCYNNQLRRSNDSWRGNISASCCANVLFVKNISVVNSGLRADGVSSDWPEFSKNAAFGAFGAKDHMFAANYSFYNNLSFDLNAPASSAIVSEGIDVEFMNVNGNLAATDPQFVMPGNSGTSDFHLKPGSPAIDAGTSRFGSPGFDLDKKYRKPGVISIGVYE